MCLKKKKKVKGKERKEKERKEKLVIKNKTNRKKREKVQFNRPRRAVDEFGRASTNYISAEKRSREIPSDIGEAKRLPVGGRNGNGGA